MGQKKLFLTGASGLLGRAVYKQFVDSNWVVYGTAFTRCNSYLHKVDITSAGLVAEAIKDFKPDFIIHCAAQRFPDLVEKDPVGANKLNVDATSYIITAAAEMKVPVLYISTDYVFDGTSPPYEVSDKPNPINEYGKTKLKGEGITLKNSENLVLRIPVLYGPVNSLTESAVTTLLNPLLKSDVPAVISHTEKRCPSHVDDIAHICWQLACAKQKDFDVSGIYQWCGKEKMTKYQMVLKMAEVFSLRHDHITPNLVSGVASTQRPEDTEMSRLRLEKLGFGKSVLFEEGISEVLKSFVTKYN